jgi:hypothetical protein
MKFLGIGAAVLIIVLASIPTNAEPPSLEEAVIDATINLLPVDGIYLISSDSTGIPTIVVGIKNDNYSSIVPDTYMGFPTSTIITGNISAPIPPGTHAPPPPPPGTYNREEKNRPIFGGISISLPHQWWGTQKTAGTLGIVTRDASDNLVILSCRHVIGLCMRKLPVPWGAGIIQPGTDDKGIWPFDRIGWLEDWTKWTWGEKGNGQDEQYWNYADAAKARLAIGINAEEDMILNYPNNGFLEIDMENPYEPEGGDLVFMSGKVSGVCWNYVTLQSCNIKVDFPPRGKVYFKDVIKVLEPFGANMDSGSIVYKDGRFVGLMFAGPPGGPGYVCKAKYIIEELDL